MTNACTVSDLGSHRDPTIVDLNQKISSDACSAKANASGALVPQMH
jgi:hypothetical protein